VDDGALRQAYAGLVQEALAGGFGEPPEGEWSAAQVLAHVIVNDRLLAIVTAELLDDGEPSFSNEMSQRTTLLDAVVATCPDLAALAQELARQGRELCQLVGRLTPELAARRVTVHFEDHGEVVLEASMPWEQIMSIHAERHLPAHLEQLTALRT
jgi:hypothetical protein